MVTIREYEDPEGRRPFGRWFDGLSIEAAVKLETALARMEVGNFSNVKSVGQGLFETRIHFGPGYRVYSVRTAIRLSSCSLVVPRRRGRGISGRQGCAGRTTKIAESKHEDKYNASFPRFY